MLDSEREPGTSRVNGRTICLKGRGDSRKEDRLTAVPEELRLSAGAWLVPIEKGVWRALADSSFHTTPVDSPERPNLSKHYGCYAVNYGCHEALLFVQIYMSFFLRRNSGGAPG